MNVAAMAGGGSRHGGSRRGRERKNGSVPEEHQPGAALRPGMERTERREAGSGQRNRERETVNGGSGNRQSACSRSPGGLNEPADGHPGHSRGRSRQQGRGGGVRYPASHPDGGGREGSRLHRAAGGGRLRCLLSILALLTLLSVLSPGVWHQLGPSTRHTASEASGEAAGQGPFAAVAWVNGEPVAYAEFRARMLELRGEVIAEAARDGAGTDARDFWTSGIPGETPLDRLKEKTLAFMVRVKVQQIAAKEAGIEQDIGYGAFLDRLDAENRQRLIRLQNGQTIYGPQQYSERAFFRYTLANLELALREELAAREGEGSGRLLSAERYEAWLNRKAADAEVRIDSALYNRLTAD